MRKNKIVSQTTGNFVTLSATLPDKLFQPERYNFNDYKNWQDDWKLINGFPVAMSPSPNRKHQQIGGNFISMAKSSLKEDSIRCNCQVYYELDWIINDETVVRPDVMIVCGNFETDFLTFPPALILEITSPSSRMRDRNTKFALYEMCGVNYYLIADTDKTLLEIFQLHNNKYQQTDTHKFALSNSRSVEIDAAAIWS